MAAPRNPAQINIVISVDVLGALSDGTLADNLIMMDDGVFHSTGQGTTGLATVCYAGQVIQWTVYAVDVQTPVKIRDISFIQANQQTETVSCTSATHKFWSGIVPYNMVWGTPYPYRLTVQMGEGKHSLMYIDTPSLVRI